MKDGYGNRIDPDNRAEAGQGARSGEAARFGQTAPASERVAKIAEAHGVSVAAVTAALGALRQGGGTMAQFSHPDFGGMAQWSAGGMSMVGDMFNTAMKAKLDGVLGDLAEALRKNDLPAGEPAGGPEGDPPRQGEWPRQGDWPAEFGPPAAAGSQNDMRYAFFPGVRRLVVEDGGRRVIYDTGAHVIGGVAQQQSSGRTLTFSSQHGTVDLSQLPVVG